MLVVQEQLDSISHSMESYWANNTHDTYSHFGFVKVCYFPIYNVYLSIQATCTYFSSSNHISEKNISLHIA